MTYTPLKYYFGKDLAELLSSKITAIYPSFDAKDFIETVAKRVDPLELKARVEVISDGLREHLPQPFDAAIDILLQIIGPPNPNETGMFNEGYWLMPVAFFVEKYGIDHFETSMRAIYEITQRNTGEYAIRPFIEKYPEQTLCVMHQWSTDASFHVRRLASEGARPRLPWAKKLDMFIADPIPVLPILENLNRDPSKFVQKSVANHLNDILKDNYETGMRVLRKWSEHPAPETKWIIKHALRNQKKLENPEALALLDSLT
ncbi:MAG: DNA alkylation repair protein [Calditrichia bacterium]|nr:DNA alkylation repair protein [Calditrichota bacterium]MCB0267578.1 DNA alkylation repair protein [Calditrichota bacterium]MCB9067983.1 DNA alkylation repair protein [Calditrichia bacterium]